ncbi:MAG: VOC family protein [Euryhalocaulis sp.]|uniref:VOC family protein n=1 Tax=Euryhalocaulis sp. TaxID=2744307 RepID=UPI00179A9EF0|nr:VOC family protein [Euryhalocaulis sp.]MBA4801380.1 VOC family protein [Euryhalocaulis sp.]
MSSAPALTPHLVMTDAGKAIEFYKAAFGAEELFRLTEPSGKIGHAEMKIGGSVFMLADEYPDMGAVGPQTLGGTPVKLHLAVENADAAAERAQKAGAELVRPPQDEFYGERTAMIADPFGHQWFLAQHLEDVPPEEMQKRFEALISGGD